jgi:archaellum component FlaG (FlaF/FlaG flagellin family)
MGMKFGSGERDLRIWNKSADGNSVSGITFWTGSTPSERMRIDYDGNVGIGTTDPSKLLTISGSGFNPRVLIDTTDTESYPGFEFRHNGDNTRRTLIRSDYESGSPNLTFYTCEDGTITEKLRIEGNGNIGIGTTTPSNILHISKSVNGGYSEALIENTATTGAAGFEFKTNTHRWKTGVNINDDYRIRDESNSNNVFTIEDGAGDNALYIKNGGNVGIGTDTPSEKLDVNGNIQLQDNGNILWDNYTPANPTAFDMAIGINVDRDIITGLDFKNNSTTGQVRFMARADDNSYVVMNSPSSQMSGTWFGRNRKDSHYVWSTGGRTLAVGTLTENDLVFGTYDTERMMIDGTTGNVGIGTTSPSEKLDVLGRMKIQADGLGSTQGVLDIYATHENANNPIITINKDDNTSYTSGWGVGMGDEGQYPGFFYIKRNSRPSPVSDFYITSDGVAGFGSSLEIVDGQQVQSSSSGALAYYRPWTGAYTEFTAREYGEINVYDNVGSWQKDNAFRWYGAGFGGDALTVKFGMDINTNGNWINGSTSDNGIFIDDSNNVGIGTNTPSEKLDVNGNANITGDLSVTGHFSAATKSFLINNPETGGKLQYGVLEGNEHAVYYRGKTSESIIELPKEWSWLVDPDNVTTTVTPIGKFQPLFVISQDSDQVEIGGVEGEYNYVIYGTRKDVEPLEVDI